MFVTLDTDTLHVDARGREVAVAERSLYLAETVCVFGDHPRERVARLVDVDPLNARFACAALQVMAKGV